MKHALSAAQSFAENSGVVIMHSKLGDFYPGQRASSNGMCGGSDSRESGTKTVFIIEAENGTFFRSMPGLAQLPLDLDWSVRCRILWSSKRRVAHFKPGMQIVKPITTEEVVWFASSDYVHTDEVLHEDEVEPEPGAEDDPVGEDPIPLDLSDLRDDDEEFHTTSMLFWSLILYYTLN